jgi:pimeloyl-ACP methyl ester carboxylesterase
LQIEASRVNQVWRLSGAFLLTVSLACSVEPSVAANPAQNVACTPAERFLQDAAREGDCRENSGCRAWLRHKVVRECDSAKYGLRTDDGWEKADATKPVVIMIHGFNSAPQQNLALMAPIHEAGFPCGVFAYPNDYIIRNSAQLLSSELRRFALQYPNRRVILVCHSMGGLVARECVENSLYDPRNVDRLIMIAPPTHGSLIAHFAVGTDLWEHWLARKDGWPLERLRDSVVDGLGEAAGDLCPASEFLTELNNRPLNPNVRYSVLLGTGARLTDAQVVWIRESVCDRLAKLPGGATSAKELDALLADIDELVEGKGDGVVAVKRGRLNGVSDTMVMPFGHIAVTGEPKTSVLHDVQSVVLARVR